MSLTVTTPPANEPISLVAAKLHLRVDHDDENDMIDALISSARSRCEAYLRGSLMETEFQWNLDRFPAELILPQGPVVTSEGMSIIYTDTAGNSQTLSSSEYQVSLGEICRIRPSYGKIWPATRGTMDDVSVTFRAGFTDAANIPPAILAALKMILYDLYENPGSVNQGVVVKMPLSAEHLMAPFVRHA